MRKTLPLVLALTLLFALTVTAWAADDDIHKTTVEYTVQSSYEVTIPESIVISDTSATKSFGVNAESLIQTDEKLTFTVTNATNYGGDPAGFRLVNASNNTVFLSYTITKPDGEDDDSNPDSVVKDTVFFEATASKCYTGDTVALTFTPGNAESAGNYTDTITITVAMVPVV